MKLVKTLLKSWLFYKKSILIVVAVFCLVLAGFSQDKEIILHKVEKGETLYKLSVIYNVPVDSIKAWNVLTNEALSVGKEIGIFNLNDIDSFQIQANKN
ncbi:MAG: LysM peptidoglycan-binding domain-containing protein [Chitinophagales bacterium]|nr:LysM peptidoglycan-binding domain-containing protein [Chitinophagales bacterium]